MNDKFLPFVIYYHLYTKKNPIQIYENLHNLFLLPFLDCLKQQIFR